MVLSLLFKPRDLKAVLTLMRAAKRRGISVEELGDVLTPAEMAALVLPPSGAEKFGLVPDAEVSADPFLDDPALDAARAGARAGDWTAAARLLAGTGTEWDRRARIVGELASVAADDDGWLRAWRAARPDDPHAAVVHAESLVRLAWQIRGGQTADRTTAAQFSGFHSVLVEAEKAARHAVDLLPADPTPWLSLVTMARGLQLGHDRFATIWRGLLERAPHHRQGHGQALQYWCAKWAGSAERMFAFAEEAAAKSPALLGLPLQAALEHQGEDRGIWKSAGTRRALDALLERLAGEGADDVALRSDRGFAAYALVENKRYPEAVEQFRMLGARADAGPWSSFEEPRLVFLTTRATACRKARRRS
ncbi:DUF4034 domain-containing protein [Amycolatopsis anabasis]|uniref:DUF4034 domain-containing protein n=1 Tax=Amycolatopsis anabasis TaxID=1840409 RepID=UPI001FEB652E|nr:DUF4034 domain-containing protein [Amycolatopsis anabasis]